MFLNYLKDIFTKKIVKKSLSDAHVEPHSSHIASVGILLDQSYAAGIETLLTALEGKGILRENIKILVFKDRIKKNEQFDYAVFGHKDLSWSATFSNSEVKDFISQKFDLLLNYYDTEKSPLLLVSQLSKARFKVGFASVNKMLNHFMIDAQPEAYQLFTDELFKYLKILNKI